METAVRDDGGDGFLRPVTNERSVSNSAHTIAAAVAVAVAVYPDGSFGQFDVSSIKKAPDGPVPEFEWRRVK